MGINWLLVHVDSERLETYLRRIFGDLTWVYFPDQYFDITADFINFKDNPEYGVYFRYLEIRIKYSLLVDKTQIINGELVSYKDQSPFVEFANTFEVIDNQPGQSIITQSYSEFSPPFYVSQNEIRILVEIKKKVYEVLSSLWKVEVVTLPGEIKIDPTDIGDTSLPLSHTDNTKLLEKIMVIEEKRPRGRKHSYPEKIRLETVIEWYSNLKGQAGIPLHQYLDTKFGNMDGVPNVPESTFYSWKRQFTKQGKPKLTEPSK